MSTGLQEPSGPASPEPPKPRLRGRIHQAASFVVLPLAVILLLVARGFAARFASAIYLLIAGTYTPLSVLALHGALRVVMLAVVWTVAAVMIGLKQAFPGRFEALAGAMYLALGWAAVAVAPQFVRSLPRAAIVLIALGGLLYTGGAVVLNRHRPDPNPLVFGYHEVWHVCMTSAAACHYAAVLLTVHAAR